jgi:hypothetical protein
LITDKQLIWLKQNYREGVKPKGAKAEVYFNRIQHRIDRELNNLYQLSIYFPELFIDEETEINDLTGKIVSHRRFLRLLYCMNNFNPDCNAAVVLEKIKQEGKQQPLTKPPKRDKKKE